VPNQTYGSTVGYGFPSIAPVTYFLTLEEYNRYGVSSVTATVGFWHTASCVDLSATFTTKGANPGQSVTLSKLAVSYGNTYGNWCEPGGYSGVLPTGSPL
jgi:hypothetical protein